MAAKTKREPTQEDLLSLARNVVQKLESGPLPRKEVRKVGKQAKQLTRGLRKLRRKSPKRVSAPKVEANGLHQ